jgi:transposase
MLHQMTWPPQSPDLNPIELNCRVKEKQPTSVQHMWELDLFNTFFVYDMSPCVVS